MASQNNNGNFKCLDIIYEGDDAERLKFDQSYHDKIVEICSTLDRMMALAMSPVINPDEREAFVRSLFITGTNSLLASLQLFRLGYFGPSVGLTRNAWEAFITGLLCSDGSATHFDQYKAGEFRENRAFHIAVENAERYKLQGPALKNLKYIIKATHQFVHPSRRALAADRAFDIGGISVGGYFDQDKTKIFNGGIPPYAWALSLVRHAAKRSIEIYHASAEFIPSLLGSN